MVFNSVPYLLFFIIVVPIYFVLPKKVKYIWLLGASYYFYMSWEPVYALLILFSTIVTYFAGRLLGHIESTLKRRWILWGCIGCNLLILIVFKYANFLSGSLSKIGEMLGLSGQPIVIDLLLPVGISFYTFQALSYTIDVYRGTIAPERNFFRYALFVSFFPQLVAGPIERSGNLLAQLKQMDTKRLWSYEGIIKGLFMIFWGLFMKMVIADRVAIFVDQVFAGYENAGGLILFLGAVGFALQIYCDFAGYSLIAIGSASVIGVELMDNFKTPYFAKSIKEFWDRWHISLSTWFRDYLYFPLGGNRKGTIRTYLNLMIVFLVSGLWHGAGWHFVVWGALHGGYQLVGRATQKVRERMRQVLQIDTGRTSYHLWQMLVTCVLVSVAWIFFRAESISVAIVYIKNMLFRGDFIEAMSGSYIAYGLDERQLSILFTALIFLVVASVIQYKSRMNLGQVFEKQGGVLQGVVLIVLVWVLFMYGQYGITYDAKQFLYFQF